MTVAKSKLEDLLNQGHSKSIRDEIIEYVGTSESRMKLLMGFFFHEEWRINQRAAWPVGIIGEKKPDLIRPYLAQMVEHLRVPNHDALVRNTIRIFQSIEIPEELEGPLYDICMNFLIDLKQAIAIRCFAMTVLFRIATKHPELQTELKEVISEFYEYGTAGYKSRAKKILKKLNQ